MELFIVDQHPWLKEMILWFAMKESCSVPWNPYSAFKLTKLADTIYNPSLAEIIWLLVVPAFGSDLHKYYSLVFGNTVSSFSKPSVTEYRLRKCGHLTNHSVIMSIWWKHQNKNVATWRTIKQNHEEDASFMTMQF